MQIAVRDTSPGITAVLHGRLYGRFIGIKSNHRRKTLHIMNQSSDFLGGSFSNRGNVIVPIQFRREQ